MNRPHLKSLASAFLLGIAGSLICAPAHAGSTKDRLLAEKSVTIGIHNRVPWGYRDQSGNVIGLQPSIIRAALAPLGITDIKFVIGEFNTMIPGLLANRFDMTAAGVAITPSRCKAVIFSEPDLTSGDGLLVAAGNPLKIHSFEDIKNNPKVRLAGARGSANAGHAITAGVPESQMQQFQDVQSMVSALVAKRVDAVVMSAATIIATMADPNITGIERASPFRALKDAEGNDVALVTAIAFRPEDTDLRDLYNVQLEKLKHTGELEKIILANGFTKDNLPPNKTAEQLCAAPEPKK
ncbi:ectoine/hydroxyectoine ABC transporter substrate-binding protein EhuB [Aminobacter aminovorans]|uniref:Periplasmic component of amino acid ABC-type transporter/signal transduction system n=1 Tax=Aminobacter aminovorans TaxID=83263 RepID=A0AAC8YV39_AMIAI|nr:ectoine/hydroxyectoine ABC transporter substrate-binding protein EhuB [Aminobacter aminovorans]AMS45048.1 Periplasmic component of amino acid ABC-type transporter/signal transduction system [Aminobacter aminovorans]MBB3710051.1 polar amino acid transport system substrate-binding protein [Aminobacter aminovorans]